MIKISVQNLLLSVAEESLYLYFVENSPANFYQYLIKKYSNDYQNVGKQLKDLSRPKKRYLISILKKELSSV